MTTDPTPLACFARKHQLPPPLVARASNGDVQEFVFSAEQQRVDRGKEAPARRYAYRQSWRPDAPHVLWVMLNPGTGETEERRRPTLERCLSWSRGWGFGGLYIGNVHPERTRSARELRDRMSATTDPLNLLALEMLRDLCSEVVVAWGSHGTRSAQANEVAERLPGALCLGVTRSGQPRHPLYVASACAKQSWPSCARS